MRKVYVTASLVVIGLSSLVAFGNRTGFVKTLLDLGQYSPITKVFKFGPEVQSGSVQQASEVTIGSNTETPVTGEQSDIPEVVLWSVVLTFPERLESAAQASREKGEDDSLWTHYFVRQAELTASGNQILAEVASRYLGDIAPLDEQARSIVMNIRARNRGHSTPTEPPAELLELQRQKEVTVLRSRDEFRSAVGEEGYAKFSRFLVTEFAKGFIRQDPKSNPEVQPYGEMNDFTGFPSVLNGGNQ